MDRPPALARRHVGIARSHGVPGCSLEPVKQRNRSPPGPRRGRLLVLTGGARGDDPGDEQGELAQKSGLTVPRGNGEQVLERRMQPPSTGEASPAFLI